MWPPALQERLGRQQRDMEEERSRLQEVIGKMEVRLSEQSRLLEQVGLSFRATGRTQPLCIQCQPVGHTVVSCSLTATQARTQWPRHCCLSLPLFLP